MVFAGKIDPTPNFKFRVHLENLIEIIPDIEDYYDWYLTIQVPTKEISEKRYDKLSHSAEVVQQNGKEVFFNTKFVLVASKQQTSQVHSHLIIFMEEKGFFLSQKGESLS